ncbi:hypothetical protein [Enterobacter cloacae complex sp. ESBL7]|uniref:DUF7448 domain-containing protein n=1 Tax=Enterobacter cloacae complex sp. ESBL7 TaxID=3163325 RepID=UPI0035644F3A
MSVTIIQQMIGLTFDQVSVNEEKTELKFAWWSGTRSCVFFHEEHCCESVWIEDITGDLGDLENSPITEAEVVTESETSDRDGAQSITWTFFKFGTTKGSVTVRWCGASNGYYSEIVSMRIEQTIHFCGES